MEIWRIGEALTLLGMVVCLALFIAGAVDDWLRGSEGGEGVKGYVMLPVFTVELRDGEFVLTCGAFMARVFEMFFAPFWDGRVHMTKEAKD